MKVFSASRRRYPALFAVLAAVLGLCFFAGCARSAAADPLAYQVYPLSFAAAFSGGAWEGEGEVTVEEAGRGTLTIPAAAGGESCVLTADGGTLTLKVADVTIEIAPDPMLLPPLCEIVSLFSLERDGDAIDGDRRILPSGTVMTLTDGIPCRIDWPDHHVTISAFRTEKGK